MRLLIGLILLPTIASSQFSVSIDSAYLRQAEGLPTQEPFDGGNSYRKTKSTYLYIISDKDLHDLFDYNTAMQFYAFDFTKFHILGRQVCPYCEAACSYETGGSPCHRNACDYEWKWEIRDNSRAFDTLASKTFPGHDTAGQARIFSDTVMSSKTDASRQYWFTSGGGDCFAKFSYQVLKDRFYPTLLLRETNYWGGCRAGGRWDFTISFLKQEGVVHYSKNTILQKSTID